jgi:TfoX/Sxy family transcriptional regulator of competence genes
MDKPTKGSIPKPDEAAKETWRAAVPDDPRVAIRPMFGNLAAFVNGNMFTGLFGNDVFVRLPEAERAELVEEGGSEFAPMPGRPMKEYTVLPEAARTNAARMSRWVERSLVWASELPPKEPGGGGRKKRGSARG